MNLGIKWRIYTTEAGWSRPIIASLFSNSYLRKRDWYDDAAYFSISVLDSIWWCWVSMGGAGWYLVVLGLYNLALLGIKCNWVRTKLLCLNILKKKMGIGSNVTKAGRTTNKQTRKDRVTQLMQWTMDGWDEQNIASSTADPWVEFSFKLANTKVTCLGHITSSSTNLDKISPSESPSNINWKISTKRHHFD